MTRDSFIFYKSFRDALQEVSEDVRLQIYDAIVDYSLGICEEIQFRGVAKIAWLLIKPQLDANLKRYINGCKGAKYGKLGGAPKGNQNARKNKTKKDEKQPQNNPTPLNENNPKTTPNDNVNVNNTFSSNFLQDKLSENITTSSNHTQKIVCVEKQEKENQHEQQLIQSMQTSPMWQEDVMRLYKLNSQQLQEYIEQFRHECRAKQTTHQNDRDIRSHFVDWLRYQTNKNDRNSQVTTRAHLQETLEKGIEKFVLGGYNPVDATVEQPDRLHSLGPSG